MQGRLDRLTFEIALIVISGLLLIVISIVNDQKLCQSRPLHGLRFFLGAEGARLFLALVGLALIAFAASAWLAKT